MSLALRKQNLSCFFIVCLDMPPMLLLTLLLSDAEYAYIVIAGSTSPAADSVAPAAGSVAPAAYSVAPADITANLLISG